MSETTGLEGHVYRYHATCHWAGDTAMGYESYDRAHTCSAPPASTELMLSADPAFLGHPEKLNPEQLVVVAASSCQLLSFLAIAARARVQVVEYDDHAEAEMPEDDKPMRLTKLTLRPDRKSTRLNSSHANISYAVFCLKKKKTLADTICQMSHA